ncbi:MAG: VCBS repeat-containing protein [Planctomycetota bacterium]
MLLLVLTALAWVVPQDETAAGDEVARAEAIASDATRALKVVDAAFVRTGDPFGGSIGPDIVSADARAAELPRASLEALQRPPDERIQVRSAPAPPEELVLDETTGREDALDDVERLYADLAAALGGRPTRAAEIKAKRVVPATDASAGTFDLRFRVRHVREGEDETIAAKSYWNVRVEESGDVLRIVGWAGRIVDVARLEGDRSEGGFVDVARSVFGGDRARWLAPSIMELRDTLDVDVGVGILGHHGVAVADVNGDGIEDVYLCQPGGIPNQLWLRRPDGSAVEVAASGGLDLVDATTSALFVDLDGDDDRDVVLGLGGGVLILARTDAGYREAARIDRIGITGLAAADVDGDRRIDVYACAYANPYDGSTFPVPYHDAENGQANLFLSNVTEAADELRFVDATEAAGLDDAGGRFSFAATFEDFDDDGDIDLYVANDFGRNALYVNDGSGVFANRAAELGVEDVAAGMGAAFADVDGDCLADLYVSNMESSAGRRVTGQEVFRRDVDESTRALLRRHAKGNTLYLGAGGGPFRETDEASAGQWAWGSIPIDLDADGRLDLFVPNGFVTGTGKAPDL